MTKMTFPVFKEESINVSSLWVLLTQLSRGCVWCEGRSSVFYLPPCDCDGSSSSTQWDSRSRTGRDSFEMLGPDMTVSDKPELVTFWGSHATSRTMVNA